MMFKQTNSVIPNELIEINISNALKKLGLSTVEYEIVGNNKKQYIGDIDVAIEQKSIERQWGLLPDYQFWDQVNLYLKQLKKHEVIIDYKIIRGFNQFHICLPLLNKNKNHTHPYTLSGTRLQGLGFIQIDFFVGNLNWMSKIVSGAPATSRYKAIYRNLLLGAIFSAVKFNSANKNNVYYKFSFNTRIGLKMTCKQTIPNMKKIIKISDKVISTEPNIIPKILFKNNHYIWDDMSSYEDLWSLINTEQFRYKHHLTNIVFDFKTACKEFKLLLPIEHI